MRSFIFAFMKYWTGILLIALTWVGCEKQSTDQAAIDKEIIEKYISDNKLDADTTGSGLYYVVKEQGTGNAPHFMSNVTVIYKGYLTDGTQFDASSATGSTFRMDRLISGFAEGLAQFQEGGKGILLIPSVLGYGAKETDEIPANSVLIFDIELVEVLN